MRRLFAIAGLLGCGEAAVDPVVVDADPPVEHGGVPIFPDPPTTIDVLFVVDDGPTRTEPTAISSSPSAIPAAQSSRRAA
jgi:hypothetical protein